MTNLSWSQINMYALFCAQLMHTFVTDCYDRRIYI